MTVRRTARERVIGPLRDFLRAEAAGGVVLLAAALAALIWANGPGAGAYRQFWGTEITFPLGPLSVTEDVRHWVNEGLMAIFFFVVGLEIKRELVDGELRGVRRAALPVVAAAGGVVLPAVIFLAVVGGGPEADGWGIPIATDIAFAVGALAVLGRGVRGGAKLFLLSVAIADDIIAITVIAVFYSASITWVWLAVAVAGLAVVAALRRLRTRSVWPYVLVGAAVWFATLESGLHATIAGVALALLTPARPFHGRDVLKEIEHRLHPVSAFVVIPIFALANAGVDLRGGALPDAAGTRLTWAVAAGLLAGKTLGIGVTTTLAVRLRAGRLPEGMRTREVWGIAALAGIGFTVSLFIADLAYHSAALVDRAKVGIFAGSLASALAGAVLLRIGHDGHRGR